MGKESTRVMIRGEKAAADSAPDTGQLGLPGVAVGEKGHIELLADFALGLEFVEPGDLLVGKTGPARFGTGASYVAFDQHVHIIVGRHPDRPGSVPTRVLSAMTMRRSLKDAPELTSL